MDRNLEMKKAFIEMHVLEVLERVTAFYREYNEWLNLKKHQQTDYYKWAKRKTSND